MSRFYLSLEDNLMRIFASDRMRNMMKALGMEKGEAIEHRMVTNAIEKAQRKVEARNFDYRKQVLEYDDVSNDQRSVIYHQRNELLEKEQIQDIISGIRVDVVNDVISSYVPVQSIPEQWDIAGLERALETDFGERIAELLESRYQEKSERIGEVMPQLEKQIMLQVLDTLWKEHLQNMDHLRQGIGLRAYANKNPKQEFKREAFALFQTLLENLKYEVVKVLYRVEPVSQEQLDQAEKQRIDEAEKMNMKMEHEQAISALESPDSKAPSVGQSSENQTKPFVREGQKVGRNDPCPCGSGKKYKACCGSIK